MPRRIFRKYLPAPETMKRHKSLAFMGEVLADPNLWHINRRSLAGAAFVGIFASMMPIPFQMILAALLAVKFHCNLPLSVVLVWISNPVTYVPIFYFNYRIGAWLMGEPSPRGDGATVTWFVQQLVPLWTGSMISAVVFASLGFLLVKLVWRLAVMRNWHLRREKRRSNDGGESNGDHEDGHLDSDNNGDRNQ